MHTGDNGFSIIEAEESGEPQSGCSPMSLRRIALVEEDRAIRDLIELVLVGYEGYDVETFDRGYDALRALNTFRPDLVLLDSVSSLPGGIELYYRLIDEPELTDVPIVFIAGKLFAHETRRLGELGPVLRTPLDPETLAAAIEEIHAAAQKPRRPAPDPIPIFSRGSRPGSPG